MRSFSIRWPAACCSLLRLFCKTETVRLFSRGENLKEALEKAIETAKPVVHDAIKETGDFIAEVKEETKPE